MSGIMIGFILALFQRGSLGHLITLDVDPEYRRTGIGIALMKDMHCELGKRGIAISILEVAVKNTAAQTLYKKLGYRKIETLVGYYRGKEDAFRLAASIHSGNQ
jgi:ribosomal-protein-alanine N-acetyltransferase